MGNFVVEPIRHMISPVCYLTGVTKSKPISDLFGLGVVAPADQAAHGRSVVAAHGASDWKRFGGGRRMVGGITRVVARALSPLSTSLRQALSALDTTYL